jgi:hypothetical protein
MSRRFAHICFSVISVASVAENKPFAVYTPKQAAEHIGVSDQSIHRWIARGIFTGVVERGIIKKRCLIPASEVERIK